MRFSHRFFLYGPLAMLVALAAGAMTYWWIAANDLARDLDQANGRDVIPGVRLNFASKRIAGFPFRLDAVFRGLTIEFPGAHGPITWHATALAAHRLTYDSDVTIFEAAGPQQIDWTDETGRMRKSRFEAGALRASAVTRSGRLERLDIDAISLASAQLAAGRAQFHFRRDPAYDALDLVSDLQSVHFASDARAGFPSGLSRVRLEGRLAPAQAFAPLLAGTADWRRSMNDWRARGGFFKVDEAAIFWAKCQATSSGNLALDEAHRLSGALAFSLAGCASLPKQAASLTETSGAHRPVLKALATLAAHEPTDAAGALAVTIVFRNGLIFVGPGKSLGANGFFEPVGFLHALY